MLGGASLEKSEEFGIPSGRMTRDPCKTLSIYVTNSRHLMKSLPWSPSQDLQLESSRRPSSSLNLPTPLFGHPCNLLCAAPCAHFAPSPQAEKISSTWVLPKDYCKKDPCNFNTEMFVSKVGNPCPTLGELPASRILYTLLVGKTVRNRQGKILYTQLLKSWPTLGQLLVNSPPHGKLQGSSLQ